MSWGPRARQSYRCRKMAGRAAMRAYRKKQVASRPAAAWPSASVSPVPPARSSSVDSRFPAAPTPSFAKAPPVPAAGRLAPGAQKIDTEADLHYAQMWMYVFFWGMLAFFVFCFVSLLLAAVGKANWIDVLKPGAWSMLFTVIFFFRWAKTAGIEKRLAGQADVRASVLRQQEADDSLLGTSDVPPAHDAFRFSPTDQRLQSTDQRLQSDEKALQSCPSTALRQGTTSVPAQGTPLSSQAVVGLNLWKNKTQRDEEWLDQELRWRLDAKHGKIVTEEERQTCVRQQQEKDRREQELARRNTEAIQAQAALRQQQEVEKGELEALSAEVKELWSQKKG